MMLCGTLAVQAEAKRPVASADKQTFFNNITDYFATIGKTPAQKNNTIRSRKYQRRLWRQGKEKLKRQTESRKKASR